MPGNAAATRLNVSCHTLWAGTAFALSLIVTRVLPRAVAPVTERPVGKRLLRSEVVVGRIGKSLEVEPKAVACCRALEHRQGCADHLRPDPVAGDHRDAMALHSKPVARPQPAQ